MILKEDKRSELLNASKHADNYKDQSKGKNRFERRLQIKIASSVREYNSIDMNKFFKDDILLINVPVVGETDNYLVKIKIGGILEIIRKDVERNNGQLDLRIILQAIIKAFNTENVYVRCTCPDWNYTMSYWSRVNDTSSDRDIEQTNNGKKIRNPFDTKGKGCKHVLRVLSVNRWIRNCASVIFNYINYMKIHYEKMYADIIYPAIYGKSYEDDVQLSMDDTNVLNDTEDELDISNKEARNRGKFKPGNQSGVQFASNNDEISDQQEFDFDSLD